MTTRRIAAAMAAMALASVASGQSRRPPTITPLAPPPIVQVPSSYGDWQMGKISQMDVAYSVNASGSVLGFACAKVCNFYINLQIRCDKDGSYVALVNSPSGVVTVSPVCAHLPASDGDTAYVLVFNSKDMVDALDGKGEVGFAVALESGKFNVARFSLRGAIDACGEAVRRSQRRVPKENGLEDYTL